MQTFLRGRAVPFFAGFHSLKVPYCYKTLMERVLLKLPVIPGGADARRRPPVEGVRGVPKALHPNGVILAIWEGFKASLRAGLVNLGGLESLQKLARPVWRTLRRGKRSWLEPYRVAAC